MMVPAAPEVSCIQSISTKMSFTLGLAPIAGRSTHGSAAGVEGSYLLHPPKVAATPVVGFPGFRCNPFVSAKSTIPSRSVSVTGVLTTMASHVRQIWLSEEVSVVDTEEACAARLNESGGLSQRLPAVPVNGLLITVLVLPLLPVIVRV